MSTEHGQEPQHASPPPPPPPPPPVWPGGYGADGYGAGSSGAGGHGAGGSGAGGYGWPGDGPGAADGQAGWVPAGEPSRQRRHRAKVLGSTAAALALIAGGSAWAVASSGGGTLSAAEVASRIDPGLVDVISTIGYQHATAEGTGMVLTSDGEVLTNNHVVAGSTSVQVRDIGNGRTYSAKVMGYSKNDDVAVLQLTGASGLTTVTIGNSDTVAPGQRITALGNAEGKDGTPSVATGTVTSLRNAITAQDNGAGTLEHLTDMIRTDANIEPGDSGGPLVDSSGQVVGMDTAAATSNSTGLGTTADTTTTAFSIPINRAVAIAGQIEAGKASTSVHVGETAFLGVEVGSQGAQPGGIGQAGAGVPVEGTVAGTAAAEAGLTGGDIIVSVDGHSVTASASLQSAIAGYRVGERVSVEWLDQAGQTHSATVTLTAGPTG